MLQVDQPHCPHALVVFASIKINPYEYRYYYYTRETYRNICHETIFLVENPTEWIVTDDVHDIVVLTPNKKCSCGRSAEKRFRSVCEDNITVKCS